MKRITASNLQIGFIGLGRMGLPMCAALVGAGYQITATDERAEARADALACGAAWRDTPAQAAAPADVLITMLPGTREVQAAMLGAAGALEAMAAGTTWIDMTSSSPAAVRPVRERAMAAGVRVLEAPVGGGVQAAHEARLQLFVGGDAGLVERHRGLLEVVGDPERIVHVGGHGTGYAAKLLVNLLWFGQAVATAEVLLLGQRAGIDLRVLKQTLSGSSAASTLINRDLDALFEGDYRVPFELSDCVYRTYRRALARYGPVEGELLAMALREDQAGQKLRSRTPR